MERETSNEPTVLRVQVGAPREWDPKKEQTGIDKRPAASIHVADPGEREQGGRSGVAGDFIGDGKHHGGAEQAVYVVAREELDHWGREIGRDLSNGSFGENVTTLGLPVDDAVIGTRWRMGSALLEVTGPRIPCRTFAWAMNEPQWVKRFTQHSRPGAYVRVVEPGEITGGDVVEVVDVPGHSITVTTAFGAFTTDRTALRQVVAARVLAPRYQAELEAKLR